MSEEVKIKISQPMFEVGELEAFDSNIHNIVEEYSKMMFKEKDEILTQRLIMKQEEEIKRLTAESTKYESKFYDEAKENERLHSIIKEVREYIETLNQYGIGKQAKKELLEILYKENI